MWLGSERHGVHGANATRGICKRMVPDLTARRFFVFLLIATSVMLGAVIRPLASALIVAAVLAGILWPLQMKLAARLGNRRSLAAAIIVFAVVALLVGPLAALVAFVVGESSQAVKLISATLQDARVTDLIAKLPPGMQDAATDAIQQLPQSQGTRAVAAGWTAVTATGQLLVGLALMLIATFSLLVRGDAFVHWLDHVMPLRRGQTRELLAEFKRVSYAVVVSNLITAAVQTVVALAGYLIARVPFPVFFAALTFFCAVIPAIGAAGVCLVAAAILFLGGHAYMATFLAIWGVVVVGLVDNVIKPWLLKGGMEMPGVVVFFALLGGLAAFGVIGLLLGPLVVSLFVALLRMYERDFGSVAPTDTP